MWNQQRYSNEKPKERMFVLKMGTVLYFGQSMYFTERVKNIRLLEEGKPYFPSNRNHC